MAANIAVILLRFRQRPAAFTAEMKEMFKRPGTKGDVLISVMTTWRLANGIS